MSETIIQVENIGKRYLIRHETRERYIALRDLIAHKVASIGRRLLSPKSKKKAEPAHEEFWALKDVSFEIKRGEVVGVIGRNGAGKSTLLKILSRITEPTTGRARVKGRVASLLEVGTGFHPELTGRENVFLNGAVLGMSNGEIRKKFDEIIAFAEVHRFLDTPVKRYSSGMYVRLAFAVAAHLDPEILLIDEVLAVGDAQFQRKCLGKMEEVGKQGRTVLFVSHNMGAISAFCKKTVYLSAGKLRMTGPTDQIVNHYLSEEVYCHNNEDIQKLRLAGKGKDIRFHSIKPLSKGGKDFLFGEHLVFEIDIFSKVDKDGLSIGSSIFTNIGVCVGTFFTEPIISVLANNFLKVTIIVSNLTLAPGEYYSGFSIGYGGLKGRRKDFDIVIGTPSFHIQPVSQGNDHISYWNPKWGSIVIKDVTINPHCVE